MIITSKPINLEECPVRQSLQWRQILIVGLPFLKNSCRVVLESDYCIWSDHYPHLMKYYMQSNTFTWIDDGLHYRCTTNFFAVQKFDYRYLPEAKCDFTKQRTSRLTRLETFHQLNLQKTWIVDRHYKRNATIITRLQIVQQLYNRIKTIDKRQIYCHYLRKHALLFFSEFAYRSLASKLSGKNHISASNKRIRLTHESSYKRFVSLPILQKLVRPPTTDVWSAKFNRSAIYSGRLQQATSARCPQPPVSYSLKKKWRKYL